MKLRGKGEKQSGREDKCFGTPVGAGNTGALLHLTHRLNCWQSEGHVSKLNFGQKVAAAASLRTRWGSRKGCIVVYITNCSGRN